jgi:cell division protease FtsH
LTAFIYATTAKPRVEVPYTPTFLAQVERGNVASITSKGTAIQGTFRQALRYPPKDENARATTDFKTEMPTFASNAGLYALRASSTSW